MDKIISDIKKLISSYHKLIENETVYQTYEEVKIKWYMVHESKARTRIYEQYIRDLQHIIKLLRGVNK